jgi:putative transposase
MVSSQTQPSPIGMNPWRAGCPGTGTSGSVGGLGKPTGRKADTAPQADPTKSG